MWQGYGLGPARICFKPQAKCIVEGIKRDNLGLAKYIVDDFGDFDPNHPEPTPAHFTLPPDPVGGPGAGGPGPGLGRRKAAADAGQSIPVR